MAVKACCYLRSAGLQGKQKKKQKNFALGHFTAAVRVLMSVQVILLITTCTHAWVCDLCTLVHASYMYLHCVRRPSMQEDLHAYGCIYVDQ